MHKYYLPILLSIIANSYAENIYLAPQYTVAVERIDSESSNLLHLKTLTPIVDKSNYLPSGTLLTLECNGDEAIINKIESTTTKIPVALGDTIKQRVACNSQVNPNLIWTPIDDYKIKSTAIKPIIESEFQAVSFNMNNKGNGNVKLITSDGNLTHIRVDEQNKYTDANFFATINKINYYVQSTYINNQFTLHAANMQRLFIISKTGHVLAEIDFPNYD